MPSPFPGMDPYLEGPLWSMVHNSLIEELARQLTPRLWPRYKVRPGERVVVAAPDPVESFSPRERLPDVAVFAATAASGDQSQSLHTSDMASPLVLELLDEPPTVVETFLEILAADSGELVTTIEVLSPSNKRGEGAAEYRTKRREVLASRTHFLEIDLLRMGDRFPVAGPLPSLPYFVFLSRCERRPKIEVWPVALDSPLPTVPVPLLPQDTDGQLDLQLALQSVYDLYHYEADIDYTLPPPLPLPNGQAEWSDKLLRESGVR